VETIRQIIEQEVDARPGVVLVSGKKVLEIRPNVPWNKGAMTRWLLREYSSGGQEVLPIYIGDDCTDEDAFKALKDVGITILVTDDEECETHAAFVLGSPRDVLSLLRRLDDYLECIYPRMNE
jgi:trehalose-phosphatase